MTAGLPSHIHITEREPDGSWEDCTWMASLEWYRDCIDPTRPATHAEGQALRAASGEPPTGGSNLGNFRKGVAVRYHRTLPAAISNKLVLSALKPGMAATVQGSMSAFGPNHRLSVFDRNFDGGHDVYIANVGGKLLWCDPEAPTSANVPVTVSPAEVTAFVNAFPGEALVANVIQPQKGTSMQPLQNTLLNFDASIKPQSNIRANEPKIASPLVRTTGAKPETVTDLVGTFHGDVDPANGSDIWYGWIEGNQWRFTAKDNVLSVTAPVAQQDDGFTKATQDAAVASQKAADQAAIDAANAAAAKSAADAAAAPAKERDRIAQAEADRIKAL